MGEEEKRVGREWEGRKSLMGGRGGGGGGGRTASPRKNLLRP